MTIFVHDSAIVESGASIGEGTSIWHQGHVRADAVVGVGCTFGKNVFIDRGVRVGNRVKVQNNVSVYSGVTLEDDVLVGPSAVFTNDWFPRAFVNDWTVVPTLVHRGASIGANATILCGTDIGELALVGAGSVVLRSVAAHELVVGNPARRVGWVCTCGRPMPRSKSLEPPPVDAVCSACASHWLRPLEHWMKASA